MKRIVVSGVVSATVCCTWWQPSLAAGGLATEWTQLANHIELVAAVAKQTQMVINQVQMIANQIEMLKSIKTFPKGEWGKVIMILNQLDSIVRQGQALSYAMQHLSETFQEKYPGYQAPADYALAYQNWSATTLDSIRGALMAAGFQSEQFATETATMTTLQNLSDSAVGQTQVIQAGNMIANQLVAQLQKLRQLQMAQMQAQNAYMAHEVNQQAASEAAVDEFFKEIPYKPGGSTVFVGREHHIE